jgi:hypothetical protein
VAAKQAPFPIDFSYHAKVSYKYIPNAAKSDRAVMKRSILNMGTKRVQYDAWSTEYPSLASNLPLKQTTRPFAAYRRPEAVGGANQATPTAERGAYPENPPLG